MRVLTIMVGTLFTATGIYLVANGGLSFMSVAFIVGLVFIVAGAVECLSYTGQRGEDETKTWILLDGATTFILGGLIMLNKLSADVAVPLVLGMWILMSGLRNFVHAWEKIGDREDGFYSHLILGLVTVVLGLYAFFDQDLFDFSTITLVGIYMIAGGLNIAHVGITIRIIKPEFLKTKEEKLEEAAIKAAEAHQAAREAIKVAKEAKAELRVVSETPAEVLDPTLAPKPGSEEAQALQESLNAAANAGSSGTADAATEAVDILNEETESGEVIAAPQEPQEKEPEAHAEAAKAEEAQSEEPPKKASREAVEAVEAAKEALEKAKKDAPDAEKSEGEQIQLNLSGVSEREQEKKSRVRRSKKRG